MSLAAHLLTAALLAASPEAPRVLTDAEPTASLRWQTVPLHAGPANARGASFDLHALAPTVLRIEGGASPTCTPGVARRFGDGPVFADVPVAVSNDRARWIVIVPPALVYGGSDAVAEAEEPGATFVLTWPSSCGPRPPRVFQATMQEEEEGWLRVRQALDSLASARPSDEEITAALRAEHAHDWQVLAALGVAARRLLGDLPGTDVESPRWVEAWRAGVARASPMPGLQYDWHAPIDWPAPSRALASDDKPSFELAGREVKELDVHRAEVVRLHVRLPLRPEESSVTTLLEARFDDRPAWVLPLVGGRDPAEPSTTRARTFTVPVPLGARSLRVRSLDRSWLVRGELLWNKKRVQDVARAAKRGVLGALRPRAAELEATDVRARFARAVAAGLAGDAGALVTAAGLASGHPVLAAWVAIEKSRLDGDVAAAERAVTAAIGERGAGDLSRATLALIEKELDDVRARAALAEGEPTTAVRTLIRAASRRALTDEEASFLADAQALVPDEVTVGTHLVALIDGLLARRPLDRMLVAARSRAFALGGTWRPLVARGVGAEVTFLDPVTGVPSSSGRSQFAALGPAGLNVVVEPSTLAGRVSVLSLVAVGSSAPEVRTVRLDGQVWARLPVTSAVERYDVPAEPGPHRLTVEPADAGGRTFSDFATSPAGSQFRARRYREIGRDGLELQAGALGVPTVAEVSLRMIGAPVTPFEVAVDLGGGRVTHVSIGATGAPPAPASPIVFVVPLPADAARPHLSAATPVGSRLFAHVAIRVRRPWQGLPVAPGADALIAADVATSSPVARAARMIDADEVLLARETLLTVLEDESATRDERRLATSLWRDLDAGAITTSTGRTLSPALCLLPQTTAGEVPPAELDVLAAARDAEAAGQLARAASLWLRLADAHPTCGAVRRQAGVTLLASDPSAATAGSASVQLALAADVDPGDLMTARAIRRAHRRTRIRWFPFAEQSAGSALVQLPRGETSDPVEADVLGLPRDGRQAGVLAKDRELTLAFSAARRERLIMRVEPIELRRRTAEATDAPPVSVRWSYDGADAQTVSCDVDHSCQMGPLDVTPGAHLVTARLGGGVRPAARLWLDETPAVAPAGRRAALAVPPASGTTFTAEYLAATSRAPIRVTLQGPVVLRLELRRHVTGGAGAAVVRAIARNAPPIERALMLSSVVDPQAVGPDLETLSEPTVAEIPLPAAAAYTIDISPQGISPKDRTLLARVGVRDGIDDPSLAEEPPPVSYVSREASPAFEPQALERAPIVVVRDGDVVPGREVLGSFSAWTLGQRVTTNPEGAPVQALTSLHVGLTYRKLVERLHMIFKADGAERVHDSGAPSQALSASLFFMHPEHRWLRLSADADGDSQVYAGKRQWAGRLTLLAEPVVTIVSGLHLVTKVGSWWSARTLTRAAMPDVRLLDPDVYSFYSDRHPRALTWEEGLETEPLSNLVLYGNARLTTNPSFRPNDVDHVSASLFARTLLGRTYLEGLGRTTWFLADANRLRPSRHSWLGGRFFQTFWPSERQMVELGVVAGYDFGTRSPEISVSLAWEGSNGRRFRDHSPFEGEDFFFPERGPGFAAAEMKVAP